MRKLSTYALIAVFALCVGCFSAGTHGSIKSYEYNLTKDSLQNIIDMVISESPNVYKDTVITFQYMIENDSIFDTYYKDGIRYETIYITTSNEKVEYIFNYTGTEESWTTSSTSSISICYAYNDKGEGGSQGNGKLSRSAKKRFVEIFESELIKPLEELMDK
ncbi:MAG: hypothetical protein JKX73_06935 [Flavobacteriales bacterium]|nr:hypothetical protein [Flavobacteriales bacterium]